MPDRQTILAGLTSASNGAVGLAIVWHAVFAAALAAIALGWRPSNRWIGVLLAAPIASVSAVSWAYENPFNGSIFAGLAIGLVLIAARHRTAERIAAGARWSQVIGACMLAFGWAYPHFLRGHVLELLVAAPLGIIPCPTLAAVIGAALMADGLRDRIWSWTLAAAGVLYAAFGVARLGVWIDVGLLVGSVALMARATSAPLPLEHRAVSSMR